MKKLLLLLALPACTQGSYEARLVNGLTGQPVPEMRVLLRSDSPDLTCQVKEGVTDAQGVVRVEGTCADTTYTVTLGDEVWFTDAGTATHAGGTASTGAVEVKVWKAPSGEAVYFLDAESSFKAQKTYADVETEVVGGTDQKVRYPSTQPKQDADWKQVPEGGWLMFTGQATIDRLKLHPAIENDPFPLGAEDPAPLTSRWHYIGAEVKDKALTVKTAELDASKFVEATDGDKRKVRFIPEAAIPAGKYFLLGDEDRRTFMLRVGPAAEAPAAE